MAYEAQLAETVLMRGLRGDRIDAYLARPLGAGPYPGVVVIHHMPGWDGPNKEITRRFAHHGFVAIVPNLHFREGKATPEENSASIRAAGGMPDDRTMGDVQGAINYLRELPYLNGKVGVIGYCSGGRQAYLAACTLRAPTRRSTATAAVWSPSRRSSRRDSRRHRSSSPKIYRPRCSGSSASRTRVRRPTTRPRPKRR